MAAIALACGGCASTHPEVRGPDAELSQAARSQLGTVALVTIPVSQKHYQEKAHGNTHYAGAGAAEGAETGAQIWAATFWMAGPLSVFTIPIVPLGALAGAAEASSQRLTPEELQRAEAQAGAGLDAASRPAIFERAFLRAAQSHGISFVHAEPLRDAGPNPRVYAVLAAKGVNHVLELRVERVSLRHSALGDASFALYADTRVRLITVPGGVVLYDNRFKFRSASQLFIEWTFNDGEPVRQIAASGYEMVAEEMLRQIYGIAPRNVTLYAKQ